LAVLQVVNLVHHISLQGTFCPFCKTFKSNALCKTNVMIH
jgi:hypothetical protein